MIAERYRSLKDRSILLSGAFHQIQTSHDQKKHLYSVVTEQLNLISKEHRDLQEAIDHMKVLIEEFSKDHIKEIESLVTYGLRTIFFDRQYSFSIETSTQRNNKYAQFYLHEDLHSGSLKVPLKPQYVAGGVLVVVGLILQTYAVSYLNLAPIIFLDEALTQLSIDYLPSLFQFIDKLSEIKGFIFVLVSHSHDLIQGADRVYTAQQGKFILESE